MRWQKTRKGRKWQERWQEREQQGWGPSSESSAHPFPAPTRTPDPAPSHAQPLRCCPSHGFQRAPPPQDTNGGFLWTKNPAPSLLFSRYSRRAHPNSQASLLGEPPSYLLVRPQDLGHPVGHRGLTPRHWEAAPKTVVWAVACLGGFGVIHPEHLLDLTERKEKEGPKGDRATPQTTLASGTEPGDLLSTSFP